MNSDEQIKAVNKVYKYINENLDKKLTLNEISNISGYSPWHISKVFKAYYGKSIFEFIRLRRLSSAALSLRDNDEKILDVALDYMFDTHEGFTRAFSKEFNITPKKYSKQTPPIQLFLPYPIEENIMKESDTMKDSCVVFAQVIKRPRRKAIIKRGIKATDYFEYCEEVYTGDDGIDVFGILSSIKDSLFEPVGMWLPKKLIKSGTSQYVQAVEVPYDYKDEVPMGFEMIELDECMTMIFQGPKYDDKNFREEISKVMKAINEFDTTPFGFDYDEENSLRFQYEPWGHRGYIEGRGVKEIAK